MRVLVINGDSTTAIRLKEWLEESGNKVDIATNGESGLVLAQENTYDVIVLDVILPVLDGWSVLTRLRKTRSTPVLFLTTQNDVADRVKAFELGGDDYMVEPFALIELLARLRSLARRGALHRAEKICIEDLEIDLIHRRVKRGPIRINLTPREFSLLQVLAHRHGHVLSRTQIASFVWEMNFESDTNVVEVAIRRLRAKIDEGYPNRLIHTVRGVGYVMMGEMEAR